MKGERMKVGRESQPVVRYYPNIRLGELRKAKKQSENSRLSGRHSNWTIPEYRTETSPLKQTCSFV
jgi:hypothetical protein